MFEGVAPSGDVPGWCVVIVGSLDMGTGGFCGDSCISEQSASGNALRSNALRVGGSSRNNLREGFAGIHASRRNALRVGGGSFMRMGGAPWPRDINAGMGFCTSRFPGAKASASVEGVAPSLSAPRVDPG